jgi:uncharacterized membrane protein HdeD (DUF308 family)
MKGNWKNVLIGVLVAGAILGILFLINPAIVMIIGFIIFGIAMILMGIGLLYVIYKSATNAANINIRRMRDGLPPIHFTPEDNPFRKK